MSGRIRLIWLVLAVFFAAAAGIACLYAEFFGSIWIQPGGNPQETVIRFFDCVKEGDYTGAYNCLSDYSTLGLETWPESTDSQLIYNAIRSSYSYTLQGSSGVNGLEAKQKVIFHSLNLKKTEEAISQRVDSFLQAAVSQLPQDEVYDGNGGYLSSLTDLVYTSALQDALQNPDPLCSDTELDIRLQFQNGEWKMNADRALMSALAGGES